VAGQGHRAGGEAAEAAGEGGLAVGEVGPDGAEAEADEAAGDDAGRKSLPFCPQAGSKTTKAVSTTPLPRIEEQDFIMGEGF
jgi:hypothetical protein